MTVSVNFVPPWELNLHLEQSYRMNTWNVANKLLVHSNGTQNNNDQKNYL